MIFTSLYKEFLIIFSIVFIHELGHLFSAKIFNWQLDKIMIYPYGGCVKFNEVINKSMFEEFIILISGPLMQIVLFLIVRLIFKNNLISIRNYLIFKNYHYTLLIFNLIPIYPLDGGKLVNIITNALMPYKKGNKLVIGLSLILIIILILSIKSINFTFMLILLVFEIIIYYQRQDYLYNKFLLERYLKKYSFKKLKIIKNKDLMFKGRRHLINDNNHYQTERKYLEKRFRRKI